MKVLISVPDQLFVAADRLTKAQCVQLSHVFAEALEEYIARHSGVSITAKLDAVHGSEVSAVDAALALAQHASLSHQAW